MAASEEARRLLAKAAEDEYVLDRLLDDAAAPEAMVGFHAQQAAEKMLKAALFLAGAVPPRTHNLTQLLDLAEASGLELPEGTEMLRWLTPYAVLYRYEGEAEADEEKLVRREVRENLRILRSWVESRLQEKEQRW
jgi:HEPN domain-containing protein